jgi:uncharacterized protein (DUF1501 family)
MLQTDRDLLVCIFQRGAADGLNAVVPYGDPDYYLKRSTINVALSTASAPGHDLDGFFGLHPALAPLKPIYDLGDLALVHATGEPHGSRSHFTAQGLVERGVLEKTGPNTGWLGRHMNNSPAASSSAFRMVCISSNVMVSLLGADEPLAISNLNDFGFDQDVIDSGYLDILGNLYNSTAPFQGDAQAALAAIGELSAADIASFVPENGAVYPTSALGPKLFQAGQLIKSSLPVEVICIDSDGWDHHENLPTYIDQSLSELAGSLAAFYTDMGAARMQRITVLVHTEFGRRVAENGSAGADHGTGSLAYLMGGGVNGGQVFSSWPGLADANLEMGEDLKITTDLRSVLAEMLSKRMVGADIANVFPGFTGPYDLGVFEQLVP